MAEQAGLRAGRLHDPQIHMLLILFAAHFGRNKREQDRCWQLAQRACVEKLDPLLELILPPSMIVKLKARPGESPGAVVKRGTILEPAVGTPGLTGHQTSIRFRTTQDTAVWQIHVAKVAVVKCKSRHELHLQFISDDLPFDKLVGLHQLTLFLHGDKEVTFPTYEALVTGKAFGPGGRHLPVLPRGFSPADRLLPETSGELAGRRMLLEFAVLPEKFLFLDIHKLGPARVRAGQTLDVVVHLAGDGSQLPANLNANVFQVGCTPAINCIEEKGLPVDLAANRFEHPIDPHPYAKSTSSGNTSRLLEVVQVLSTRRTSGTGSDEEIPPLFDVRHCYKGPPAHLFYQAARRSNGDSECPPGTVHVRLVDESERAAALPSDLKTLAANVLLCHGDLAVGRSIDWASGDRTTEVLVKPTVTLRPHFGEATQGVAPALGQIGLPALGTSAESIASLAQRLRALLALHHWQPSSAMLQENVARRGWLSALWQSIHLVAIRDDGVLLDGKPAIRIPGRCCVVNITPTPALGNSVLLIGNVLDCFLSELPGSLSFTRLALETPHKVLLWKARLPCCSESDDNDAGDPFPQLEAQEKCT
jgi:type VI protein secretion system component VasA